MPNTADIPARDAIRVRVIHNLAILSGKNEESIKDEFALISRLGLTVDMKGALAPGFEVIAKEYNPNAVITKRECKQLTTVSKCIELVCDRSRVKDE